MRSEKKFQSNNRGHNTLASFNNLAQVRITTSKTMLEVKHNKLAK